MLVSLACSGQPATACRIRVAAAAKVQCNNRTPPCQFTRSRLVWQVATLPRSLGGKLLSQCSPNVSSVMSEKFWLQLGRPSLYGSVYYREDSSGGIQRRRHVGSLVLASVPQLAGVLLWMSTRGRKWVRGLKSWTGAHADHVHDCSKHPEGRRVRP